MAAKLYAQAARLLSRAGLPSEGVVLLVPVDKFETPLAQLTEHAAIELHKSLGRAINDLERDRMKKETQ